MYDVSGAGGPSWQQNSGVQGDWLKQFLQSIMGGNGFQKQQPDLGNFSSMFGVGAEGPPPDLSTWDAIGDYAAKIKGTSYEDLHPQGTAEDLIGQHQPLDLPNYKPPTGPGNQSDPNAARPPFDPNAALFQAAMGLIGGSGQTVDYESMQQEAADAIRQMYGAQIDTIQHSNRRDKKYAANAQDEIGDMYAALARSNNRAASRSEKANAKDVRQVNQIGNRSVRQMRGAGERAVNEQAQMMQDLGTEAAAGDVLGPQQKEIANGVARARERQRQDASYTEQLGNNQRRFFENAASGARLEGTNRQADIVTQLQDILAGRRDQIGELAGQRGVDIANSNNAIQTSAADLQSQAAESQFDQLMQLMNYQSDLQDTKHDNQVQDYLAQLQATGAGPQGLNNFLPDNYQDAFGALGTLGKGNEAIGQTLLKSLMQTPEVETGQYRVPVSPEQGGTEGQTETLQMTPEKAAAMMEQMAREQFPGRSEKFYQTVALAALTANQ